MVTTTLDSETWTRLERWVIILIALHSYAVGLMLLVFTHWTAALGGWVPLEQDFFPRQGGIFHVVVATGYLLEYFRYRGVSLLITAKFTALVFLLVMWRLGGPWPVPLSGLADGAMGAVVMVLHRRSRNRIDS